MMTNYNAPVRNPKSKVTAGIFALLLGGFGVDLFYVGRAGMGIFRIILTVTIIGALASGIWSLVSGIQFLTMSDAEFDQR